MIGARKRPQVALEFLQEFHLDDVFLGRHEIAERHFQILRAESRRFRQQLVSRPRREHHEVRSAFFAARHQPHLRVVHVHARHARAHGRASRCDSPVEQQPVQHLARVNYDRMAHLDPRAMPAAGNQLCRAHNLLGVRSVEQERIRLDRFMSQAAAAGLLPRQALVENCYVKAVARKALAAKRAGGSASDNRDVFHGPGAILS